MVSEIKEYDWCAYVLKRLGDSVTRYKKNADITCVTGCVVVLMTAYISG